LEILSLSPPRPLTESATVADTPLHFESSIRVYSRSFAVSISLPEFMVGETPTLLEM
jgi:hypothetical protein